MSYYFHPGAEAEHFEAIAFLESRQLGLGASYLAEFEELMANVVQTPHHYRIERKPIIRRVSQAVSVPGYFSGCRGRSPDSRRFTQATKA